jgi:putative nucleotidyltransferase with HDIG domain
MSALSQRGPVEEILASVQDVAVLPQVIFKVIEITGNPSTSVDEIEHIVAVDPGFCARLLQLVNSAYYCLPKQVGSVKEAVMFIGFSALRQLATTIGAFDLFMGKADKASLRRRLWWRHSLDAAVSCRWLATEYTSVNGDEAYAAALLHDIGKSILDRYESGHYDKVEYLVKAGAGVLDAETAVYKTDHCAVGYAVTAQWRFPSFLVECAGYHHVPGPDMDNPRLCALVAIASVFADLKESGERREPFELVPPWAAMAIGMTKDMAAVGYDNCCQAIEEASSLAGVM